jgi:hypothetical protein
LSSFHCLWYVLSHKSLFHEIKALTLFKKQYQQDLFNELRAEDELVILARGLGLLRLVANLLHAYDAAGNNLVLVVGADDRENQWIGEGVPCRF